MTFLKCFENEINIIVYILSYLLIHTCCSIPLLPKLTEGQFSSEEKKQPELISQIGCKSERFLLHTVHVGKIDRYNFWTENALSEYMYVFFSMESEGNGESKSWDVIYEVDQQKDLFYNLSN